MVDTPTPEALAQAEAAARDDKRQAAIDGSDVVAEVVGAALDGAVGVIVDGAAAVAEGAVNIVGGIIGGLAEL